MNTPSFKELLNNDIKTIFLNPAEFGELHNIIYSGQTYEKIPVVLTDIMQSQRIVTQASGDHAKGLYTAGIVLYAALSDLDGNVPEQGKIIQIDDGEALGKPFYKKFTVSSSRLFGGMIEAELEAIDE